MRKNRKFLFVLLTGFMFASCAGEEEVEVVETQEETAECVYSYTGDDSKVEFTAYKFLNKTGVGGAFTTFDIEGGAENTDPLAVVESLSFQIPISSLDTKDAGRDGKITEFFFEEINTDMISGKVVSLDGNGTAVIEITMNDITNEVEGTYSLEDASFEFSADIDVLDWDAESGIDALNEECNELHIDFENGDTESKLWSEVAIKFTTTLNKVCD